MAFACIFLMVMMIMGYQRTNDEFIREMKEKNPKVIVLGKYTNAKKKIEVQCIDCGHIWKAKAYHLLKGHACPECRYKIIAKKKRELGEKSFLEKIYTINPYIRIKSEYVKSSEKIIVECLKCGNDFPISPNNLLRGKGCPRCVGKYRITHLEFIEKLRDISPNIEILSEYKNTHSSVKCRCKIDGCIWYAPPHDLLKYSGCPVCSSSKGENRIATYLYKNNYEYIAQKTFGDLKGIKKGHLSYDFYIPSKNILIEYQGQQHERPVDFLNMGQKYAEECFKRQKKHDELKRKYAERHNIKMLEIWYWDFDNIEQILGAKLNE